MAVNATQVQNLYLAYFGRPAEQAGLTYWTSQADATVDQISAAFAQQPEYTAAFSGLTRSQVVNQLYTNLFGRAAASNELNYWVGSTDVTVDKLALALTNGATGTDRLLLDSKIQYATSVTATEGSSATADAVKTEFTTGATVTVGSNTYTLAQYTTAPANGPAVGTAAQFYSLAATQLTNDFVFSIAGNTFANANGTAVVAANGAEFSNGAATGTITLSQASNTTAVAIADGQTALTGITLTGTSGTAASSTSTPATPAATVLNVSELGATDQITTLTLNISNAATAPSSTTVGVSDLTALTTVNAAGSSSALTIDATGVAGTLTSLTAGSGNDSLTVAAAAKGLTINAGAGDDVITLTTVTTGANATVNHVASITLGAGNDTLNVNSLTNLVGTFTLGTQSGLSDANAAIANDLIKVTDFGSGDKVVLNATGSTVGAYTALSATAAQNATAAATLVDAANIAAAGTTHASGTAAASTSFVFNGNTYILNDAATGAGALGAGDGLIELTGFTGQLTSANFAHA